MIKVQMLVLRQSQRLTRAQNQRPLRPLAAAVILLVAALLAWPAQAQPAVTTAENSTVSVNYVYAAALGFGGYTLGGLTANVYTLPLSYTLHDFARDGWALKLLLPVEFGTYDFSATVGGQRLSINQQSLSVVPGAELQIPLTDRWTVKPFAQFGPGYSFGAGNANPGAWIYLAGARSLAQWRDGEYTFSLGNGLVFAGDQTIGSGFSERYVSLQLAGEIRHPLGFEIGHFAPDLGVYAAEYYYPAPLKFSRFLHDPLRVDNQNEVGFTVGSAKPMKLAFLTDPRIGAGIVFGGGLTVYHIVFGFPF